MKKYFRITVYNPETNVTAILDSNGYYDAIWKLSAFFVKNGWKVKAVAEDGQFEDGNIPRIKEDEDHIVFRRYVSAENLRGNSRHLFHTARLCRSVVEHKVGVKHRRDVCKSARTVKCIKTGYVRVTATENEDESVILYRVCHSLGSTRECLCLVIFYRFKIFNDSI